jgi:hypothetical protein
MNLDFTNNFPQNETCKELLDRHDYLLQNNGETNTSYGLIIVNLTDKLKKDLMKIPKSTKINRSDYPGCRIIGNDIDLIDNDICNIYNDTDYQYLYLGSIKPNDWIVPQKLLTFVLSNNTAMKFAEISVPIWPSQYPNGKTI